jgi:hypothetical protein
MPFGIGNLQFFLNKIVSIRQNTCLRLPLHLNLQNTITIPDDGKLLQENYKVPSSKYLIL